MTPLSLSMLCFKSKYKCPVMYGVFHVYCFGFCLTGWFLVFGVCFGGLVVLFCFFSSSSTVCFVISVKY